MTKTPAVSIIIPCYNSASYLPFCLDSIKNQTISMDKLQIILIDDASTDSTLAILNEFEHAFPEQVLLLPLTQNQGQGYGRNLALEYATGDYILFVDADDTIAPYAVELLLEKALLCDCDMLEFDFSRQFTPWASLQTASQTELSLYDITDATSRQIFCTSIPKFGIVCNKLYRRNLLIEHNIRFAEHLAHEDTLFSQLATFYTKRYAYLPVALYYYRPNPQSTMLQHQTNDYRQFDRLQVQMQFLAECEKRGLLENYYFAVEAMFIRTYYLDTLLFVLERFANAPLKYLEEMQHTVRTCFPNFLNNPFLDYQPDTWEKFLLNTIPQPFSEESFSLLKTQLYPPTN